MRTIYACAAAALLCLVLTGPVEARPHWHGGGYRSGWYGTRYGGWNGGGRYYGVGRYYGGRRFYGGYYRPYYAYYPGWYGYRSYYVRPYAWSGYYSPFYSYYY